MSSIVESLDETACNGRLIYLSCFAHDFIEAPWTMQMCSMALSFETIIYIWIPLYGHAKSPRWLKPLMGGTAKTLPRCSNLLSEGTFWELDSDHDFLLDKDDLLKYDGCAPLSAATGLGESHPQNLRHFPRHALSRRTVDRIFSEVTWKWHPQPWPWVMASHGFTWHPVIRAGWKGTWKEKLRFTSAVPGKMGYEDLS